MKNPIGLTLVLLFTATLSACVNPATRDTATFPDFMAEMEQQTGGNIGVYAMDTGSRRSISHRPDQRFAMASTFKPLLVAAVLAQTDAGRLSLDDQLTIDPEKLVTYSPVTSKVGANETISLAQLCAATMTISDNTAANLLLDQIGGPVGLTQFLRQLDDGMTRLDRYEVELNTNLPGDKRDTTTPREMVSTLKRILLGDVLSAQSRIQLQDWLVASKTGSKRLRAGLPPSWRTGDKTGTGSNGAANNIAITWPPGRPPLIIAVYMTDSKAETALLNDVHAGIAEKIVSILKR